MKSLLSIGMLISSTLVFAGAAMAAPILDKEVRDFLSSTSVRSEQVLPVLLTYKQQAGVPVRPSHPRYHAEIEKAMIRNTQQQEAAVFKTSLNGSAQIRQTLWIVNGTTTALRQEQLKSLLVNTNLASITYSHKKLHLIAPAKSNPLSRAETFTYGLAKMKVPELRAKFSTMDGSGVRVGILDTGIDPRHPDLAGKVIAFKDFTKAKSPVASDEHGHGTHVAGTIAGGATSGLSIGVAPKAQLIIGKIFDAQGSATDEDIMVAMQWMADPDGNPNTNDFPHLVSNSWGDDTAYDKKDPADEPMCKIINAWVKLGMVPVFAAGNSGPGAATVGTPGGCPQAFAVGATDTADRAAYFSSRGPAKWKTGDLVKPDIAAPGVRIMSAKPGGGYQSMDGTSMATPHISGVITVILQANPALTVEGAVKTALAGVTDLGTAGKDMVFGWGRADLFKSVDLMKPAPLR